MFRQAWIVIRIRSGPRTAGISCLCAAREFRSACSHRVEPVPAGFLGHRLRQRQAQLPGVAGRAALRPLPVRPQLLREWQQPRLPLPAAEAEPDKARVEDQYWLD